MRTVERLQQIKALDRYIDSQIEQIKRLESQALKVTAGAMQTDMVQGGKRKGKDDIYVELMMAREELERFTAEAKARLPPSNRRGGGYRCTIPTPDGIYRPAGYLADM